MTKSSLMRSLLFLLSFFLTLQATSLNDYSIVIKGPFEDALFDITEDHDGQISATGYSQQFSTHASPSESFNDAFAYLSSLNKEHGEQIRVIRLNDEGETTLDTSLALSRFNRAVSLIKTPSNGYFIGGYSQDGKMLVLSLSSQGNVNFIAQSGTANFDRMHRLVALRDGGVLAVGSSVTSHSPDDPLYEQGLGLNDIYLARFSKTGQKLWSKKYGTPYDDRGIDAAEAYDGSIIVAGTRDIGKDRALSLMRITENGDKIWFRHFDNGNVLNAYSLIALHEGNFLTSLSYRGKSGKEQIRLLKFDLQQNILAERNVSTEQSSALHSIKERSNGMLIGVGHATDIQKANTDALAISFDASLQPIWQRRYGQEGRELFRAVTVLHDGSFAAAGETVSAGSERPDMWIVKLGTEGSIASKPVGDGSLYDDLCRAFSDEIDKKMITVTRDLRVTLQHPSLLFKVGVYELTDIQKKFLKTFSKKLLDVLHPYKSEITGLRINGHTSSEWEGADFTHRYLNNAKLSTLRAYSVLSHIFALEGSAAYRQWLSKIISNDGYAFSKTLMRPAEDRKASRRAEFQIVLR